MKGDRMSGDRLHFDNLPDSDRIWKELGGNYDDAGQVINEFVDNAIGSIIRTKPEKGIIEITLMENEGTGGAVDVTIEDSGGGIGSPSEAFTLGERGKDSVLNEHGLGMKQALSAANPGNDSWEIYTRSGSALPGEGVMYVRAPYDIGKQKYGLLDADAYPGHPWGNTYIKVRCLRTLFENMSGIEPSARTSMEFGLEELADRIHEELGFTYAGVMERYGIGIRLLVRYVDGRLGEHEVTPLVPAWEEKPSCFTNDGLEIEGKKGRIRGLPDRIPFNNSTSSRYYKRGMESAGVVLRIRGRVVEYGLFEDVFGIKKQASHIGFHIQVDLVSNTLFDLPATRTSKDGFRIGDGRLAGIYAWLRKHAGPERTRLPKPVSVTELDRKKKLAEILETLHFREKEFELTEEERVTSREVPVFTSFLKSGYPKADLVVKESGFVTIVEAKKEGAGILDLYQLKMYCDGYRMDNGKGPDSAILVASSFPESLERFRYRFNKDNPGCPPIEFRVWDDYMEDFEEVIRKEKEMKVKY